MIFSNKNLLEIAVLGYLIERTPKELPSNKYEWPVSLSVSGFCHTYPDAIHSTVYRVFSRLRNEGMIIGKTKIRTASRKPFFIYVATTQGVEYYNITCKYLQYLEMAGFISPVSPTPTSHLKVGQGTGEASEAMVPPMVSGAHGGMN